MSIQCILILVRCFQETYRASLFLFRNPFDRLSDGYFSHIKYVSSYSDLKV